jgi:spore photoproduct lyase
MKQMRKQRPDSQIIQYPFENENGVFQYGKKLSKEMIDFAYEKIRRFIPEDKIFLWEV